MLYGITSHAEDFIMHSSIQLVALDMDGTLLNSSKQLPADFIDWVRNHPSIQTVISSGRQYYNLVSLFEPVKDQLIYISDNQRRHPGMSFSVVRCGWAFPDPLWCEVCIHVSCILLYRRKCAHVLWASSICHRLRCCDRNRLHCQDCYICR